MTGVPTAWSRRSVWAASAARAAHLTVQLAQQKTPARQEGTGVSVRPSTQVQCGRNRLGYAFNVVREDHPRALRLEIAERPQGERQQAAQCQPG
jgi:hypothetical protein